MQWIQEILQYHRVSHVRNVLVLCYLLKVATERSFVLFRIFGICFTSDFGNKPIYYGFVGIGDRKLKYNRSLTLMKMVLDRPKKLAIQLE